MHLQALLYSTLSYYLELIKPAILIDWLILIIFRIISGYLQNTEPRDFVKHDCSCGSKPLKRITNSFYMNKLCFLCHFAHIFEFFKVAMLVPPLQLLRVYTNLKRSVHIYFRQNKSLFKKYPENCHHRWIFHGWLICSELIPPELFERQRYDWTVKLVGWHQFFLCEYI